jgi:hypothetical protein
MQVFHVETDDPITVGSPMVISCTWFDGSTDVSPERVTVIEPTRICWDYEGMPEWLLSTERCIAFTEEDQLCPGGAIIGRQCVAMFADLNI